MVICSACVPQESLSWVTVPDGYVLLLLHPPSPPALSAQDPMPPPCKLPRTSS